MPNNCKSPEMCLLSETCVPCAICPNAKEKADDRLAPTAGSGSAAVRDLERHNAAWVKHFIKPVARFMRERGISEVRIKIGKDGKASYLLEPDAEWLGDSIQNDKSPSVDAIEKSES